MMRDNEDRGVHPLTLFEHGYGYSPFCYEHWPAAGLLVVRVQETGRRGKCA